MSESERLRLLSLVVRLLNQSGSWTGRTHIQKLVYFAQQLLGIAPEYEFVLYQRGPYCFQLDSDVRSARAIGALDIVPQPPYHPSYIATSVGEALSHESSVVGGLQDKLRLLAEALGGPKQARDLELLATTLYVGNEGYRSNEEICERVLALKPHFLREEVERAMTEVGQLKAQFS